MKSKIIGSSVWSVAFGSILYSYLSGDENYAGVGVALVWIGVIIVVIAVLLSAVVFGSGTEEQKKKTMEAYLDGGAFARFIGWLKTCSMFILLCISSYWFTGVVYLLMAIIMACIEYCVRESEKNAANIA